MPIPPGVRTRRVLIARGALAQTPALLTELGYAGAGPMLLLADARTHAAAGEALAAKLTQAGFVVQTLVLPDNAPGYVSGDHEQADAVTVAATDAGVVLGVGAGVINDLGKLAARRSSRPYVAIATAASMNGYGSPIAAILDHGIKRTVPAAPTDAIVADLDVLAAAPVELARSGFADLLSKHSATADWMLAHLVRGDGYDSRPHAMLEPLVSSCAGEAAAIGRGKPAAMGTLIRGLIGGGFAMTLAGRSTPASGGEHLLSHYWDMQGHAATHQAPAAHPLHGYQVAIGTRLCTALWERLLALPATRIDVAALSQRWQPWAMRAQALRREHGPLFSVIEAEAQAQQLTHDQYRTELEHIARVWPRLKDTLAPMILPLARLKELHAQAQVPATAQAVGQTAATVRHALLHAADVRARYTVLDLARQLGVLEAWADELMAEAQVC
jgi:glycerol-1-phosphate dehydrogenase [NAD(P)+]